MCERTGHDRAPESVPGDFYALVFRQLDDVGLIGLDLYRDT